MKSNGYSAANNTFETGIDQLASDKLSAWDTRVTGAALDDTAIAESKAVNANAVAEISRNQQDRPFDGRIEITFDPPVGVSGLLRLKRLIEDIPGTKLIEVSGRRNQVKMMLIAVEKPLPLLELLRRTPNVEEVRTAEGAESESLGVVIVTGQEFQDDSGGIPAKAKGLSKTDMTELKLGYLLQTNGLIKGQKWQEILAAHQETGQNIGSLMIEQRIISRQEMAIFSSLQHNVPFIDIYEFKIDPEAVKLIPEHVARRSNAIPIGVRNEILTIAMKDPWDIRVVEGLAAQAHMNIRQVEAVPEDILKFIDLSYKVSSQVEKEMRHIPKGKKAKALDRISADVISQTPIVRAVDMIIEQAIKDRASDVHVWPEEDKLRIRYRIDGFLVDAMSLPTNVHLPLVSRLKILASLNIADRRRSQDGQFSFKMGDREVDIRVATSDTVHGEMVVMRILDKCFALFGLDELGCQPESLDQFRHMLGSPFGMILLSGPTGSGKTTTLYAAVNRLNRGDRNIMTIEDPVEYRFAGINQIQVNNAAGITFAGGLRSLMRLDPDIILVGEIRDRETAEIAVQASLTGHLVLSSIHANDSVGALFRLMDLGIEPFLISSSLVGVVAQRMVRQVCPHCQRLVEAPHEEQLLYEQEMGEKRSEFFYGQGCSSCANTGYQGRTGVYEILETSETSRRLIVAGGSNEDIRKTALQEGMMPMWRDGMIKVKQGITTPHEILRNVYSFGSRKMPGVISLNEKVLTDSESENAS